ncbi:MAG: archaellin/type IV pilin N-terminal domain-containing protein [Nitrososphaerales archaeon]|jgi:flagellin-like protein
MAVGRRRAVSEVIATLLLIALTVTAAVLLFGFATGLFSNLTKGGPSYLVTGSGGMVVPGSTNSVAVLTITLHNDGGQPIVSVSASCGVPPFVANNCGGLLLSTPVPVGSSVTNSTTVRSFAGLPFIAGTSYTVTLMVTFDGGSTQVILISVRSIT